LSLNQSDTTPERSILSQFRGRQHGPLIQFIKYAIAGVIATSVNILVFYLCAQLLLPALSAHDVVAEFLHLHVPPVSDAIRARNSVIDNVIAFMFSNMIAYLINIAWVFEPGRHHRVLEILYFYLVSGVSMVIGSALMAFLIARFGITTTTAFGASILVSLMINYVLR
jgi:putative flippase GtrA